MDESVNSDVVKKEAAEVTTVAAPVAEVKVEEQQQSSDVEMSEVYADFDDAESLQPESGNHNKLRCLNIIYCLNSFVVKM